MKPPYEINPEILKYISSISEKIGEIKANYLDRPDPILRKKNEIITIHSSLKIEGNSLSEKQVTDIMNNRRVIGKQKDILEVKNAIEVYSRLKTFDPLSMKSFLFAHKLLMKDLIENPGQLRKKGVGIFDGSEITHLAPPAKNVLSLMKGLFDYLNNSSDPEMIISCVFHYEIEFIHPFLDGNGRMGRLWQTVILMKKFPVFEFIPFENLISRNEKEYYNALAACDKEGKSTIFIEYMLKVIDTSLDEVLNFNNRTLNDIDRLEYFISLGKDEFARRDYMDIFKDISSSTASRDLKKGVKLGLLTKTGEKNKTVYKIVK
ncbi:Fic family protein [bacterium]|nr:Fic family protein [bacterium]